ncbi:MAG: cation diffusion facilitator family transporter [Rhodocyclaceae bacterium]
MSAHDIAFWQHDHDFGTCAERNAERRTRWVVGLTFFAMLVELAAGWLTGSMALLADGWHMASHVGALGIAAYAYRFSRQHANDARYTFGTGKVTALAGYSSALFLGIVAAWMAWESVTRLWAPVEIHYAEAMVVATFGLIVNLASAWLLDHDHDHEHVDHNHRAAYLHVLADALTSVLAILALGGGLLFSWALLDPVMGVVGALVVGRWAFGLARDSAGVLLDAEDHGEVAAEVRKIIGALPDHEIADLHIWRIGPASRACILSLVSHDPLAVEEYHWRLSVIPGLDHVTIEVNQCRRCGERQA